MGEGPEDGEAQSDQATSSAAPRRSRIDPPGVDARTGPTRGHQNSPLAAIGTLHGQPSALPTGGRPSELPTDGHREQKWGI